MFPEYRDLITSLKHNDHHFTRLFDKHNDLDQKIKNMEDGIEQGGQAEIETLKREKLQLKDELYLILKKASSA
ncbi:YdcH family protein [Hydrogenophaga sp.]|uniref:YdcH family protein n=1 Tax=Hydrogenophaga sp. TaxID=1904254 RepID=UPI002716D186|nr:YdcH family protein [Hydrogenophaga sp.]MDO8903576.1 YdcH family protein [Hydrogenophaga sp.]